MKEKKVIALLALTIGLILIADWLCTELSINRCLDESGAWDYTAKRCEYE